jgi:hypothetical protein
MIFFENWNRIEKNVDLPRYFGRFGTSAVRRPSASGVAVGAYARVESVAGV